MSTFFKKYWTEFVVFICILVCLISLIYYFQQFGKNGLSTNTTNWGTFGDYIGGVLGTILSFFSVVLIYATYKNQIANSLLQQFETTYFNLLANQREILKSLGGEIVTDEFLNETIYLKADEYISGVAKEINGRFDGSFINYVDKDGKPIPNVSDNKEENQSIIDSIYNGIFLDKVSELGHYFRHLYHFVKYVHESSILNKKKYIDIIQAQMSDDELYVTFYNCISEYGNEKFRPMLDYYHFFENIRSRGQIFELHCKQFYSETSFKY